MEMLSDQTADLVVAGGVGSYVQTEIDGIVQVGEGFGLQCDGSQSVIIVRSYRFQL